jgi:hypothetical protein
MPKKSTIGAAGILAAGAVAAVVGLSGGENDKETGDVPQPIQSQKIFERDVCTRAVRSDHGKLVRVVGVSAGANQAVEDTVLGRAVVVDSSSRALCHVVIDSPPKKKTDKDGVACSRDYANVPELLNHYGRQGASCPVKIHGSEVGGSYLWSLLLVGESCQAVADLPCYVGSDMHEFLALPMEQKRRFLKVRGRCTVDGGFVGCTVPVGDPRADPESPVSVPHRWAGRRDLNYVRAVKGKPELRYDIPDGGFEAKITENP